MDQAPERLSEAVSFLLPKLLELREHKATPIVLIDGRSGSGKSSLAEILKNMVFEAERQSPRIIHMDDLYPGWEGLREGSLYLTEQVLKPLIQLGKAEWQRWDWAKGARGSNDEGNGWRSFEGQNLLIVEGCGSVTEVSRRLADLSVWVESDTQTRKERFLARDGGKFAGHWAQWSAQEDIFFTETCSDALSDLIIHN